MKIEIKTGAALQQKTPCLVLGVFAGKYKAELLLQLDQQVNGAFGRATKSKEFSGRNGETLLLHGGTDIAAERILLVGLGKETDFSLRSLRQVSSSVVKFLTEKQLRNFVLTLPQPGLKKTTIAEQVQVIAEGVLLADYRYDRYLPAAGPGRAVALTNIDILLPAGEDSAAAATAIKAAEAICSGVCFARDLVNAPGNLKSPEYLAMQAVAMAEQVGINATLLDRREMERQGFGALLGVAQGSVQPPYLIVLEYRGGKVDEQPIALVGKGVTFDAGGISLKPAEKMDEMKMDMGGAATVLGTMQAAAQLQLPVNLVAVVPAVENMPSGSAIRPGDILTSLSGKTIEVMNTDAEGRLILADALTYVGRYQPREVIDLATLTGACIIALGNQAAAVLGNNEPLIRQLIKAGERSGERFWQLPLWDEYSEQIKSNFAEVKNTGGRAAGTITAAAFLQKFAHDYKWAHLDIAGVAWEDQGRAGQPKGGTGFGVRALIEYLREVK
ncbi:MAG: leucyl aminopeptidase [Desulfuromonadales bacterium]|nr:leucyl aminopeptidase [Desulfuromonadales bacterium]